jgi:hypothetical protein
MSLPFSFAGQFVGIDDDGSPPLLHFESVRYACRPVLWVRQANRADLSIEQSAVEEQSGCVLLRRQENGHVARPPCSRSRRIIRSDPDANFNERIEVIRIYGVSVAR